MLVIREAVFLQKRFWLDGPKNKALKG